MRHFLKRPLHVSWLIAILSAVIVGGVALSVLTTVPIDRAWGVLAASIIGVLVAFRQRQLWVVGLVVVCGAAIGLTRGSMALVDTQRYEPLYGTSIVVSGVVGEDPSLNSRGDKTITIDRVVIGETTSLPGSVYITLPDSASEIKRSDDVRVEGELGRGFGGYAGTMYRATVVSIKRSPTDDIARDVRDWFSSKVRAVISEPQASLGMGFLTGQKSALPPDLETTLQIVGLTHVVVASGYNLTILVRFARRVCMRISRFSALGVSLGFVAAFIAVTGMSPSMSRAGLVTVLGLLAWYYGRRFHPFVLLLFVAGITVMIDPRYAWGDLGWLLSFSAFFGVLVVAPLLQRYFFGDDPPGILRQILGETVAAHAMTLPIIMAAFGLLSHSAIIANILVVPFIPFAMLLVFMAGITGSVWQSLSAMIGDVAEQLLSYMVHCAQFLATLPWSVSEISIEWWHVTAYYAAVIAVCVYMKRAVNYDMRQANLVE